MPFRSHIKRFLPSFNKTAACEGQQKAVQPSDQHTEVVTEIDVESSASPASNVDQDVPTATSVQSLDLTNLWECAFKEVENKTPDLIESYKQNLVRTARRDGASSSTNSSHPSLENFIKTRLQELQRTRTKLTIAGREVVVRDEVHRMMNTILAASDLIGAAVSSEPHAAVVWAGILFLMNPIANIITQSENAMSGFEEISNILIRYRVMEITPVDISATRHLVGETRPLRELAVSIRSRIIKLYTAVLEYQIRLTKYLSRSSFLRLAGDMVVTDDWAEMLQTITNLDKDIQTQWGTLDSQVLRNIESEVLALQHSLTSSVLIIAEVRDESKVIRQNQLLDSLEIAKGARFDSFEDQHKSLCLEGTQVGALRQIQHWLDDIDSEPIYWLTGMAGTGKSTISRTVASGCYHQTSLGESPLRENVFFGGGFFFDKNQGDRRTTQRLFTTLCKCLADYMPELKVYISNYISAHSSAGNESINSQWKNLILDPLLRVDQTNLVPFTLVLVIDALDECDSEEDIEIMLQLFNEAQIFRNISLRFFITSRPETHIQSSFDNISKEAFRRQELQKITLTAVSDNAVDDITKFLYHELEKISSRNNLGEGWPGDENIRILSTKSDGLFIYAATACRFLGGARLTKSQRETRLANIFAGKANKNSPEGSLDQIYLQILEISVVGDAMEEEKQQICDLFRNIVGAVVNFAEPLSMKDTASLLSLKYSEASEIFERLHSVLSFGEDKNCPVRLVHLSFRDFLLDEQRCRDQSFWINQREAHESLLDQCLDVLSHTLRQDICALRKPSALAKDIQPWLVEKSIPLHAQYASLHWIFHLCEARVEPVDDEKVHNFLRVHLLHWLETLSVMGRLSHGVDQVMALYEYINGLSPHGREGLCSLVLDIKRFVLSFRAMIEETPLQIYISALVHSPAQSLVRRQWEYKIFDVIARPPTAKTQWNSWQQTLPGWSSGNPCLAFSPNGSILASDYARLWNPVTGTLLNDFDADGFGELLEFSHDGHRILCLFSDGTVRIWNVNTGKLVKEVMSWDSSVQKKTIRNGLFSYDQSLATVVGNRGIIQVLDLEKQEIIASMKHESKSAYVVAFSHDSSLLASSAKGRGLRLWKTRTGKLHFELVQSDDWRGPILRGGFSQDDRLFACIRKDKERAVNIWDSANGTLTKNIEGPWLDLVFLPNGELFLAGEKEIRIFDLNSMIISRTIPTELDGIIFAADYSRFVTWSSCHVQRRTKIQTWDTETATILTTSYAPLELVQEVALAADKGTLAVRQAGEVIRVWDLAIQPEFQHEQQDNAEIDMENETGKEIYQVIPSHVYGFGLSFSTSENSQEVQLWSSESRTTQRQLGVSILGGSSLSRDGRLLVRTTAAGKHQVQDIASGEVVREFEMSRDWVSSAIFSPDGTLLADGTLKRDWSPNGSLSDIINTDNSNSFKEVLHARVWDIATGDVLHQFKTSLICDRDFLSVKLAFSPDGNFLAVVIQGHMQLQESGTLEIWDVTSWEKVRIETLPSGYIHSIALSPGAELVAFASPTLGLRLWDLNSNSMQVLKDTAINVAMEFSPVLGMFGFVGWVGDQSSTVIGIWDVKTAKLLGTRGLGRNRESWLRFSADGKTVDTIMGRLDTRSFYSEAKLTECHTLFVDFDWVVCGSEKVFRFPIGTEVFCAAAVGDTLMVSYVTGGVDFLDFKPHLLAS